MCDILVIPSSPGGMSLFFAENLPKLGIPLPPALAPGELKMITSPHPRFPSVAYVGTGSGTSTDLEMAASIGAKLGMLRAFTTRFMPGGEKKEEPGQDIRIATPLLFGAANPSSLAASMAAVERGFLTTAGESAVLFHPRCGLFRP